ncbi:MAG: hypothetical protein RLZZ15_1517, partial [Verrucomicrobiota bacterium]
MSAAGKPLFAPWHVALVLAAAAAGVWLILPDDAQLLDGLVRDGSYVEARRVLGKLSPAARARRAAHYRALELRLTRLETRPRDPLAFDAAWRAAATAWRETAFDGEVFLELAPLVPALPDPVAAWNLIAPDFSRAPEKQRARLAADFVRAALAANQPATAAAIFSLAHPAPRATADALELARLWQLAGRAPEALAALGDDPAPAARRVELLRATNRNRDALALLAALADAAPDRAPDAALAEQIAATGLAAGQAAEAAALVARYVEKNPADLAAARRLRALHLAAGQLAPALAPARAAVTLGARHPDDVREL